MPCPWYRNGMCTSPKLRQPSRSVVSPQRCMGSEAEYKSCRFYVDPPQERRGRTRSLLEQPKPAIIQQLRPYMPIHLLSRKPNSNCPYIKVYSYSGGYLAQCLVLNRLLTKSELTMCEKYWQSCPFYRMASKRERGEE
jgi:hypothetical protein